MNNLEFWDSMYNFDGDTADIYSDTETGETVVRLSYEKGDRIYNLSLDEVCEKLYHKGWIF